MTRETALPPTSALPAPGPRRLTSSAYVLAVLALVCTFNFADRQILAILMEPIAEELKLTDSQLGLLSGLTFALFYVILGLPIARLADRSNRVRIIVIALVVWSAMTALCGRAGSLAQLAFARFGVGVGEAGAGPPAQSLISDYFPLEKRATAMAIYSLGIPFGLLVGYLVGGWVNQIYGWRAAFFVMGVPGFLLALVVIATLREPPRKILPGESRSQLSFLGVMRLMFATPSLRLLILGSTIASFVSYGVGQWVPVYLIRTYGMGTGETGTWLALTIGTMATAGIYLGGVVSDSLGRRDRRWHVRLPAYALLLAVPCAVVFALAPSKAIALAMLFPLSFLGYVYLGPMLALVQSTVPPSSRATAAAVMQLFANLVGLGLGPLFIGVLSDALQPHFGSDSLRYSLLWGLALYGLGAIAFWRSGRTIELDLRAQDDA